MTLEKFFGLSREFILARKGVSPGSIELDEDLVTSGVVDSLLLVQFFFYVESLVGRPIETEGFTLDSFRSLRRIYESYLLEPAQGDALSELA